MDRFLIFGSVPVATQVLRGYSWTMVQECLRGVNPDSWHYRGVRYKRDGDMYPYECQLSAFMDAFARWGSRADWLLPFDIDVRFPTQRFDQILTFFNHV